MIRDRLLLAWIALCALSVAGAVLTRVPEHLVVQLAILALALAKSRLILHHYLGLAEAPRWRRGFDMLTLGFVTLIAILALLG